MVKREKPSELAGAEGLTDAHFNLNSPSAYHAGADLTTAKNTPAQKNRRKIAREVLALSDDIAREAGYEPAERRTAQAITNRIYERAGEDCETPRGIALVSIGKALTSKSDDEEACKRAAIRHVGHLFNHAIPRTGIQILTRYKAEEDSGRPHEYADHLTPIAAFFSELLAEETAQILALKDLDRKAKRAKIEEIRSRFIAEALTYLPKCDVEVYRPILEADDSELGFVMIDEERYAYMPAAQAKAFCEKNPQFTIRRLSYTPPATEEEEKRKKPFFDQDLKRIESKIKTDIEKYLDDIAARNSFDEARLFSTRLIPSIHKLLASWAKVSAMQDKKAEEKRRELIHAPDLSPPGEFSAAETPLKEEGGGGDNLSPPCFDNLAESNDLEEPIFEIIENDASILSASENFDSALEAALFYARDGWPVIPICQFDYETDQCTASWHPGECAGKKPLVKGDGSGGYSAATRDLARIRYWWETKYPDAGVGIRLDGHINIDCDVKDGGLESYEVLRDTFDLPETLTQITQSGGRHYVFKMPDDLPAEYLKSWTRVGDRMALGGIDLKVGDRGLLFAEPTIGSKGYYRWVDPTVEPATLPREVCDFLHAARYKDEEVKAEKRKASRVYSSSDQPREFDPDQAKYFRELTPGESRHKRLFGIAVAISKQTGASADKIKAALNYHAERYQLDDQPWIDRVAATLGGGRS